MPEAPIVQARWGTSSIQTRRQKSKSAYDDNQSFWTKLMARLRLV